MNVMLSPSLYTLGQNKIFVHKLKLMKYLNFGTKKLRNSMIFKMIFGQENYLNFWQKMRFCPSVLHYNFENMRRKRDKMVPTTGKQLFSAETSWPQFMIFLFYLSH